MIVARGMGVRVLMGTKFPLQDEKFSGCMLVMTTQRSELYQRGCVCVHAHAHTRALSQVRLCDSGLLSASLLCPWDSPGKSTGVGCHCLTPLLFIFFHHCTLYLKTKQSKIIKGEGGTN